MRVTSVGFAPVKGTRHASYDAVLLDAHGPVGDRAFCLVDVPRRHVLRTVRNPSLLAVRSCWDGDCLQLLLPSGEDATAAPVRSGEQVTCDYWGREVALDLLDGPHAALASSYLDVAVRLAAAPPGGVVYGAAVSLVSRASIRWLADRLSRPAMLDEAARFRATLVVDAGDEPFVEETWAGREVRVGSARIRVIESMTRCAVIDLDPATGVPLARVLRAIASRTGAPSTELPFGMDAHVVTPGRVRPGDAVEARLLTSEARHPACGECPFHGGCSSHHPGSSGRFGDFTAGEALSWAPRRPRRTVGPTTG